MHQRRCHGPRRFADDHRRAYSMAAEGAARERVRDQSYRIDGLQRRTQNVVKVGSKPLQRTTQ
jgi:hypothetical protein